MEKEEVNDFYADPAGGINIERLDETKLPSFSIIVPTWEDYIGLGRTLCNIIYQSLPAINVKREVLVVGDGYEEGALKMCQSANAFAKEQGQNVAVWYYNIKTHTGNGNFARRAGLKKASGDWVMFQDAGTAICFNTFATLTSVIQNKPKARLISWDIVQLLDPVPVTSVVQLVATQPRNKGLSYVIPGVSAAVKREDAQSLEWPDVRESDWAYFSLLWENMYGKGEDETEEVKARMSEEVILIPWVMTVAYGNRTTRKERVPANLEDYKKSGYDTGFREAASIIEVPRGTSAVADDSGTADAGAVQSA